MDKTKWLFVTLLLIIFFPVRVFAQQACQQQDPCASKSDLNERASCYAGVVDACRNQGQTLSAQIDYLNNKIRLIILQIENTRAVINKLSGEINDLNDEITRLEGILTKRSELILRRIPATYKRSSVSQFGLLFFSRNFSDFITRIKYLVSVEQEDATLLFQVKATQNNYSQRKQVREEKKQQQVVAQTQLEQQNADLAQQKQAKDALLVQTQGQEATYQQLLAYARAQLAGFASFTQGLSLLSGQTSCNDWGCYYSQRDSQWGNNLINGQGSGCDPGNGPCSILRVGCLVTSVAMVASHYGRRDITPLSVATSSPSNFSVGTALLRQGSITVNGTTINRTPIASNLSPDLLSNGPVIVGMYVSSSQTHFVVIKSYTNGTYIMNDPVTEGGHDISFTDHYSLGSVFEVDRVTM